MTITPHAFTSFDSAADWPTIKRHMILNGQDVISLPIDDMERLLQSQVNEVIVILREENDELRSTMARAVRLLTPDP